MPADKYKNIVEVTRQRAMEHPDRNCVIFLEDGEKQVVGSGNSG